jgi:FkbH-like protein
MTNASGKNSVLERCAVSTVLFKENPTRRELAELKPSWSCREIRVRVHRNHSFEHAASAAEAWAAFGGFKLMWSEAPYDDSLSMQLSDQQADLDLIWYDIETIQSRTGLDVLAWLRSRAQALRGVSAMPILMVIVGLAKEAEQKLSDSLGDLPGVRLAPVSLALAGLAEPFDRRMQKFSGSRLSQGANLLLAKHMACRWLPAVLAPRIKAVIVDLDQTLYEGVIGEDGAAVRLTPAHAAIQSALVRLKESGVFIGIVSRNTPEDVRALFAERKDFPLKLTDCSAVEIGWGSKAEAMLRACQKLKISHEAVLFIDDNPGELVEVAERLPATRLLHASQDKERTLRELEFYPGLWSWGVSSADLLRIADLEAEAARKGIQIKAQDKAAYLRELSPQLEVRLRPASLAGRLHELSQKTNQFNLSLRRLDEVKVYDYLTQPGQFAVAVGLSDRLTDSGVVAAMFGRIVDDEVFVEEWVISCRALGRELEDAMAASALSAATKQAKVAWFHYRTGPRNAPAREWLARLAACALNDEGRVLVPISRFNAAMHLPVLVNIQAEA